jgi:hypothetical protein
MWNLFQELEVLEGVFTVNVDGATIRQRPMFAKVEVEVGLAIEQVYIQPSPLVVRPAPNVKFQGLGEGSRSFLCREPVAKRHMTFRCNITDGAA